MGSDDQGADEGSSDNPAEPVDPTAVGEAAVEFMTGLADAFGTRRRPASRSTAASSTFVSTVRISGC